MINTREDLAKSLHEAFLAGVEIAVGPDGCGAKEGQAAREYAAAATKGERGNFVDSAARYAYLRSAILRQPISVDAWGHPTYGVVFEAPKDLTPDDFDRMVDALSAADDGKSTTVSVPRDRVEPQSAAGAGA